MMIKKLCRICKDEKPLFDFYKSAKGKYGHGTTCKLCDTAYQKTRKEQKSVSNKKWLQSEKGKSYKEGLRKKTKEKRLDHWNNLTKNCDLESWKKGYVKRNLARILATPSWVDAEHKAKISNIYAITQMFQESTGMIYHVDHIVPLISNVVCGLHVWWNLQPLPEKTNAIKNNILNPAIFPEQGEVAFPDGIRAESARIADKKLENSDE